MFIGGRCTLGVVLVACLFEKVRELRIYERRGQLDAGFGSSESACICEAAGYKSVYPRFVLPAINVTA